MRTPTRNSRITHYTFGRVTHNLAAGLVLLVASLGAASDARAHGERNQEPFLRMRTAQWYDVKWSASTANVNDEVTISGKVRLFPDWPSNLPHPDTAFIGNGTPGPVFARTESYLNGVPMIQSTKLELGRDYEFKTVLKARIPGLHHVHPLLNVSGAGPILGPGNWIEITGRHEDFRLAATTLTGVHIDNLETYGLATVYTWHALWIALGAFWLVWWLRRPLLIPRFLAVESGEEAGLITGTDKFLGAALGVGVVVIVVAAFLYTEDKYPRTIPLQAGKAVVEPLPVSGSLVKLKVLRANYDVPGRSMRIQLEVTNGGDHPVSLGEFTTAGLRFINQSVPAAVAGVDPSYPKDLVARTGIKLDKDVPVRPGETKVLNVDMTDAAWEVERLVSLVNDPDSRFGGLVFFFDENGTRSISEIMGPIVPTFVHTPLVAQLAVPLPTRP
jgi:methane/ammonia monooxygenase subunit B